MTTSPPYFFLSFFLHSYLHFSLLSLPPYLPTPLSLPIPFLLTSHLPASIFPFPSLPSHPFLFFFPLTYLLPYRNPSPVPHSFPIFLLLPFLSFLFMSSSASLSPPLPPSQRSGEGQSYVTHTFVSVKVGGVTWLLDCKCPPRVDFPSP